MQRKEGCWMEKSLPSLTEKSLDSIDKKIIDILQKNARTPIKEIAKEVFLSSPAVSARIEKLEKSGIIVGYQAQINPFSIAITKIK